jgi:biopolymer transport protein ExbD
MADVGGGESRKPDRRRRGRRRRVKRRRSPVRIDMTPMVDVAFLLLIFFMVTTVFRRPLAMEVNLPEPNAKVEVPESNVMTVYVDRGETMYAKMGKGELTPVNWPDLAPTFAANSAANENLIILVKIHRKARYETMVDMMDTLEEAKMQRFSVVRMQPADEAIVEAATGAAASGAADGNAAEPAPGTAP